MSNRKSILTAEEATYKLKRLSLEIAEQLQGDSSGIILIGVQKKGFILAGIISKLLETYVPIEKTISVSLDKDCPTDIILSEKLDFNDKNVLLIDDVVNNGKTLLYALKPLLDYHPKRIQTLALVERMHKLFPVKSDYVGMTVSTTLQDHIEVTIDNEKITGAYIV